MARLRFHPYSIIMALLLAPAPVLAHNGAVAIAVPVEGISVDGDISDWPEELRRYPIALVESGGRPGLARKADACWSGEGAVADLYPGGGGAGPSPGLGVPMRGEAAGRGEL